MLKKRLLTAYSLLREGGIRNVYAYSRRRLRVLATENHNEIRIDRCTFSLRGVEDSATRIELVTGTYEAAERRAVDRYVQRDLPVVELGGSMGVVACVTNRLLLDRTAHVVVEANPLAIPYLERNRQLNGCQFGIVNRAIAYEVDTITFRPATDLAGSSITRPGPQSPVTVAAGRLGELVQERGFHRFTLVCDIEGLEYDLVFQEAAVLVKAGTIIMETHARFIGEDKFRTMMNKLEELGFRLVEQIGFVVVLQK